MNILNLSLAFILAFTTISEASIITYGTTYATNGTVTAANLNGNFTNVSQVVNGGLDNTNANTTQGYRFYQTVAVLPAAGNQGSVYFLTSDNSLNFDTGSAFIKSIAVTGTPLTNQVPLYNGSAWIPTTFNTAVPTGSVIMWYGTIASIPTGYQLCDGSNSTPDLRSKIVPATAAGVDPGAVSGTTYLPAHTHTIPNHQHQINANTTAGGRTFAETVAGGVGLTSDLTTSDGGGGATSSTGTSTMYALAYICKN